MERVGTGRIASGSRIASTIFNPNTSEDKALCRKGKRHSASHRKVTP
jgi:hypothetical protein